MTLQEAIRKVQGRSSKSNDLDNRIMWMRPTTWKGNMMAYTLQSGAFLEVPSKRGGKQTFTTNAAELSGDWEVVSADEVLDGK